jgi:hypothetical protein
LIEALVDAVSRVSVLRCRGCIRRARDVAGTEAKALASVTIEAGGQQASACCIDEDTSLASLQAVLAAIGRALAARDAQQAQAV